MSLIILQWQVGEMSSNPLLLKTGEEALCYLNLGNHKEQYLLFRRLDYDVNWEAFIIDKDVASAVCLKDVIQLQSTCIRLKNEILKSDAKSLREAYRQWCR